MENASKAILIAGGVLLAIIVITICMLMISNAKEAFVSIEERKQAQMVQEQTVKFAQYAGRIYLTEAYNCFKRVESYNEINGTTINCVNETGIDFNDATVARDATEIVNGEITTNQDGTIATITFSL